MEGKGIFSVFRIRRLYPELSVRGVIYVSNSVFRRGVFVLLKNIQPRLWPWRAVNVNSIGTSRSGVTVISKFTSADRNTITRTMNAVFSSSIRVASVIQILIYPKAFTTFWNCNIVVSERVTILRRCVTTCVGVGNVHA